MTGEKHDAGKARWDLMPWEALRPVVVVLGHGAAKYAPDNWRRVPKARDRYFAAALRHLVAWREGEQLDPESREPHLAHALRSLLFLQALDPEAAPGRVQGCGSDNPSNRPRRRVGEPSGSQPRRGVSPVSDSRDATRASSRGSGNLGSRAGPVSGEG